MKKAIKYLLVAFMFTIAFLAVGERFVYHLAHFEGTFWAITFEYDLYGQDETNTLMRGEIAKALEEHSFDVFRVDTRYLSDYKQVKTVYGTQGALEDLRKRGIVPQTYQSMFIGEVEIIFKDFSEIENIYESDVFYYIGTLEQAAEFKNITTSELNRYYHVKDLKELSGSEDGVYATIILVWGTVFLLAVLLTLYNVILSKKETTVKLTLGSNPYHEFAINVVIDTAVFSALFFGLSIILEQFSHVRYKFGHVCIMFIFILILNTLVNLLTTRVFLKRDLSGSLSDKGAMIATYIVKSTCILMAITVLSANCVIVAEALNYFKQEEFFSEQKEYSYYKFYYSLATQSRLGLKDKDDKNMIKELWRKIDSMYGFNSIHQFDLSDSFEQNVVLLNRNAVRCMLPYLSKDLAQKLEISYEEKLYVFFPQSYGTKDISDILDMTAAIFLNNVREDAKDYIVTETYNGRSRIIGINSDRNIYRSAFLRNPVIIFDNIKMSYLDRYMNPLYFVSDFLYDIPQSELDQLINEFNLENEIVTITNSQELYLYNCSGLLRNVKLISAVTVFILFLEVLMIIFCVRLEYMTNGVEMAIKKTLGYGVIRQNKRLIMLPLLLIPVCTLGAVVVIHLSDYGDPVYALVSGAVLLIAELVFIISQCIRVDKIATTLVLKGEKL